MKEGGTSLHKTIREINLVYKGLKLTLQYGLGGLLQTIQEVQPTLSFQSQYSSTYAQCHSSRYIPVTMVSVSGRAV